MCTDTTTTVAWHRTHVVRLSTNYQPFITRQPPSGAGLVSTGRCERRYRWQCKHYTALKNTNDTTTAPNAAADAMLAAQQLLQTDTGTVAVPRKSSLSSLLGDGPSSAKHGGGASSSRHSWKSGMISYRTDQRAASGAGAPVPQLRRELTKGRPGALAQ